MLLLAGSMVVYPGHGVAEVKGKETKVIGGAVLDFYRLQIVDSDLMILMPIAQAELVLRELIPMDQLNMVLKMLREPAPHQDRETWNRRYRGFMEKIKTGSLFEVAEVFRDLHKLKDQKTLSFGERRMLDTASKLVVVEIACVTRQSNEKTRRELERLLAS